ncbi:hypothetical protein Agabi119p4_10356 [Agaricus bisporus var. burnettii]|uniref:Mug135-like C-terminal domain-containing protein n=1 Tax=Agaricus bisporus var. burnettii TaxID=192524 RepID=A0A8H7EWI9_AGABI|nr:hypothetical protein Agabi119p4_10356 [Agaricus bisporus var. burnettii]
MPMIALPQFTGLLPTVKMPPAPANPPTPNDVANARLLSIQMYNAFTRDEDVEKEDIGLAVVYEQQLGALSVDYDNEVAGGAPAWFAPAIQLALADAFATGLAPIQAQLNALGEKVDALTLEGAKTRAMVAKIMNRAAGSADNAELEVVPFRNGEDPTAHPHSLPPLTSSNAINNLTPAQRDRYLRGYYPGAQLPRQAAPNPLTPV